MINFLEKSFKTKAKEIYFNAAWCARYLKQ